MIEHLAVAIVSAIAFLGAILLYGAFSPRRLEGWKFWLCFATVFWQTSFFPFVGP